MKVPSFFFLVFIALAVDAVASELVVITPFPREVFEPFRKAFEARHPEVKVVVKHKTPQAAIIHIRGQQAKPDSDIFWADDLEAFSSLKQEGLLERYVLPKTIGLRIPPRVGSVPIHDPDGYYFGFALSGYGLMWNPQYLRIHRLPPPKEWTDLTNPAYFGHLVMGDPSKSGTMHRIVELILQGYGWERGWEVLLTACGSLKTVTKRGIDVAEGIASGRYGIGMIADTFVLSAVASGSPVGFAYPAVNRIVPASVGIIKGALHPGIARGFIHFLLSEEGQRLLLSPKIGRLPVIPALHTQAPLHLPSPFTAKLTGVHFNARLSSSRRVVVDSLFSTGIADWFPDCQKAWGAVYKAEAAVAKARAVGVDTAQGEAALAEARRHLTSTPISEKQASDELLMEPFQGNLEAWSQFISTKWVSFYQGNRGRAIALADAAEKMLGESREKIPAAEPSGAGEALQEGQALACLRGDLGGCRQGG